MCVRTTPVPPQEGNSGNSPPVEGGHFAQQNGGVVSAGKNNNTSVQSNTEYALTCLLCRPKQSDKQRMRSIRTTLKLGMKLNTDEKTMTRQFHRFHKTAVR